MGSRLDDILAATRRRVAQARASADLRELERQAAGHVPRGFGARLAEASRAGVAVIAELKKASPSRGLIRADFDAAALARELAEAGATALSVLTDHEFFQGSLENLRRASGSTSVPCLRKDFIVDEFQLVEARANSADAVLLIVAALEQRKLAGLYAKSRGLGLDVLCEVHDEAELERALEAGCDILGVNSRDLRSFKVDAETPMRLAGKIPAQALRVAESGIRSGQEMEKLRAAGYHAFLIGEWLMRAEHPGQALRGLLSDAMHAAVSS